MQQSKSEFESFLEERAIAIIKIATAIEDYVSVDVNIARPIIRMFFIASYFRSYQNRKFLILSVFI